MLLLPFSIGAGLALGCLRKGRLGALGRLRFRASAVIAVALAAQLALPLLPDGARSGVVLASYGAAGAWLLLNAPGRPAALRCGLLLVAAGWFLNLLPIAANGTMPVSASARQESHRWGNRWQANLAKHEIVSDRARLGWLGDVIPARPLHSVMSVGDLVIAVGIATVVAGAMAHAQASPGD